MTLSVKSNGVYGPVQSIYQKQFGTYFPANNVYVKQGGTYVSQGYNWNNGPIIHAIVPIGSSTTYYALDSGGSYNISQIMPTRMRFCEMSMDLPVITNGFSMDGGNCASGAATIDAALTSLNATGIAAKGIVFGFPINLGNNDIIGYRYSDTVYTGTNATLVNSWPVATQAKKDAMIANLTHIVNAIYAAGHQPMLGTVNPRGSDAVFSAFADWNTHLYKPLINTLTPQWVNTDGNPVYDMETLYHFWHSTYNYDVWFDVDGTHPSLIAIDKIQRYLAQSFGRYSRSPRLTNQSHSIIISFSGAWIYGKAGINQIATAVSPSLVYSPTQTGLYDRRGILNAAASFSITGVTSYSVANSKGNLGVYTVDLNNHDIQKGVSFNSNNTPIVVTVSVGAAYANKNAVLKVTLATNTAWGSTYTVQGTVKTLQGNLAGPQIAEFPVILNSSGSVSVTCTRGVGNYYIGISGVELIFD